MTDIQRIDADESGPVRCGFINSGPNAVDQLAAMTGLTFEVASDLLDKHLVRGDN